MDKVAGIVLAGGKSSRMGTNKALMIFRGKPLVEHMCGLLRQAECADVHIAGEVPGYEGIRDAKCHEGPACVMVDLLHRFNGIYRKILFVPVDMPLIQVKSLRHLLVQDGSVYYRDHPLPACLETGEFASARAVKEVLLLAGGQALDLLPEWEKGMANINTQKEWEEFAS